MVLSAMEKDRARLEGRVLGGEALMSGWGPVCLKGPVVTPTFLHPIQTQTPGLDLVTC